LIDAYTPKMIDFGSSTALDELIFTRIYTATPAIIDRIMRPFG
jgi:hypothetical protein